MSKSRLGRGIDVEPQVMATPVESPPFHPLHTTDTTVCRCMGRNSEAVAQVVLPNQWVFFTGPSWKVSRIFYTWFPLPKHHSRSSWNRHLKSQWRSHGPVGILPFDAVLPLFDASRLCDRSMAWQWVRNGANLLPSS